MNSLTEFHGRRPSAACRRAALPMLLALAAGWPVAQAAVSSRAYSDVFVQHSAAFQNGGWDPEIVDWLPAQPGARVDPLAATSELRYTSNVESRLTMTHEARATAAIEKGVTMGRPATGPSLKVETYDRLEFNGTPIHRDDGAAWRRSVSVLSASAALTMDLDIVAVGQLPYRIVFYWQVDGEVTFDLTAPTPPLGVQEENLLSIYADQLRSTVGFGGAQTSPACPYCLDVQRFSYGIADGESLYKDHHPRYHKTVTMPPQFIPVGIDVTDATMTDLSFMLSLDSVQDLWNVEYANNVLYGTAHARFNNSATLLGVLALDAEGREISGVSYTTSDPDLFIPVLTAPVPEPGSALLIGMGLAAMRLGRRSRSNGA
jgi:hypothetical protein